MACPRPALAQFCGSVWCKERKPSCQKDATTMIEEEVSQDICLICLKDIFLSKQNVEYSMLRRKCAMLATGARSYTFFECGLLALC